MYQAERKISESEAKQGFKNNKPRVSTALYPFSPQISKKSSSILPQKKQTFHVQKPKPRHIKCDQQNSNVRCK